MQKEHYTSYYTIVKQKYQKKPDQIPLAEEYARTIECEEGRQQVKVIVEVGVFLVSYSTLTALILIQKWLSLILRIIQGYGD